MEIELLALPALPADPKASGEFAGIPDQTSPTWGFAGAAICGTVALADK